MIRQEKDSILGMEPNELTDRLTAMGEPSFRAGQVFEWLHKRLVTDYDEMTNLPKVLRQRLATKLPLVLPQIHRLQRSRIDGTRKYLFLLEDGNLIESVLMKYRYGYSVCISSQAGCAMGCTFCASTSGGLIRNLTTTELLGQVYAIARSLPEEERISHVVVMGTGEPLLNLEHLLPFIRILSDERGMQLSKRNITVSTCGIVPGIRRLAAEQLPITLALSLHAPTQALRQSLMPIAGTYPLEDVLEACRDYFQQTGRRMTYEYAMIRGVNDSAQQAKHLVYLFRKEAAHLNLIPLNGVDGSGLSAAFGNTIRQFAQILANSGINVTIRRSLGADIDGACGQLRRKYMQQAQE